MKNFKRIFAVVLAVMMLVMMVIPASAAITKTDGDGKYSYTIYGKSGYTFTVYKVADYNVTTGEYTNVASTGLKSALENLANDYDGETVGASNKDVLAECNKLTGLTAAQKSLLLMLS